MIRHPNPSAIHSRGGLRITLPDQIPDQKDCLTGFDVMDVMYIHGKMDFCYFLGLKTSKSLKFNNNL